MSEFSDTLRVREPRRPWSVLDRDGGTPGHGREWGRRGARRASVRRKGCPAAGSVPPVATFRLSTRLILLKVGLCIFNLQAFLQTRQRFQLGKRGRPLPPHDRQRRSCPGVRETAPDGGVGAASLRSPGTCRQDPSGGVSGRTARRV